MGVQWAGKSTFDGTTRPAYTPCVSRRSPGQKPILIPFKNEFLKVINEHYERAGYDDRSKFIRAAVREKLMRMKVNVPIEWTLAPGRADRSSPGMTAAEQAPSQMPFIEKRLAEINSGLSQSNPKAGGSSDRSNTHKRPGK